MSCFDSDTEGVQNQCAPSWLGSCRADADCGAGFTCLPFNPCLDPREPDCEPEGEPVCFITDMQPCQVDSDCLPDWTCENNPLNAFWVTSSGETGCNIVDPALVCMPPHASIFGIGAAGYLDFQTGVERTFTSVPESECPEPTSPNVPYGVQGGVIEQGSSPEQSDSTAPTPGVANPALASASGNSGCSISIPADVRAGRSTETVGFASVLGLLGLVAARRRHRSAQGSLRSS